MIRTEREELQLKIERTPPSDNLTIIGTLLEPEEGKFKFSFSSTDLVRGYSQKAQVEFIDDVGRVMTGPVFLLDVEERFEL